MALFARVAATIITIKLPVATYTNARNVKSKHRSQQEHFFMVVVDSIFHFSINKFVKKHLKSGQKVRSDALPTLNIIDQTQNYEARVTPSYLVDEWLPWVHIAIGNFKTFLLGTFHGVSGKYLQEYLDEFCYRFNRRFIEKQIPNRLLNLAIVHAPVKSS